MVQLGDNHGGISCSITDKNLNLKKLKDKIKKAVCVRAVVEVSHSELPCEEGPEERHSAGLRSGKAGRDAFCAICTSGQS